MERPASVVKELVENALDAGAGRIRVEVRGGGAELVAVADDGWGMAPEDARLALERHATSKLGVVEDLSRIDTFGFRGEALPAIASVSRLKLRTRPHGAPEGFEIQVDRGRVLEARTAGGPEGTRVEVTDLFAGVPARRKFLKSPATEWGHVADWLARIGLALPEIHFELFRDDRPAVAWPATRDPLDRIATVLSEREAAALVPVEREEGRARLRAYFSRPDAHRPTSAGIHLFVNGRPVRDRLLRHAVLAAYRDTLPRGRFPSAIVFLQVPPDQVDVNVHPAKWEVRFQDPQAIHGLVGSAARAAFASRGWLGPPSAQPAGEPPRATLGPAAARPAPAPVRQDWIFASDGARMPSPGPAPAAEHEPGLRFRDLLLLGQLLGTYLVLEGKEGLLLVDQHAAHERVLYERLRQAWIGQGVARQALLIPEVVELPEGLRAALERDAQLVEQLGFEVEAFDDRSVALRAIPAIVAGHDPVSLLRALAEELGEALRSGVASAPESRILDRADRMLATLACHSARTAGEVLEAREQRALLEALDGVPWAPTCPHGRPIAVAVSLAEIERRFGRR